MSERRRRRRRRQIYSGAKAVNEEDPKRDRATPEEEEEVQMAPLSAREQIIYTVKCFVLSVLPLPSSVRPAGPWLDRYTRSGIFPRHSPTEQTIMAYGGKQGRRMHAAQKCMNNSACVVYCFSGLRIAKGTVMVM